MKNAPVEAASSLITVRRGLQVLRAFRSELAPLTNGELVRRTGLPKATVSRLTSTLLQLGYLRLGANARNFELAAQPLAVGHAFASSSQALEIANPFLQTLADLLEVSATLAIPDGSDMLYIAYRASARISTLRFGVGSVLPMGQTAVGRAYLWGLPQDERQVALSMLKRSVMPSQWPSIEAGISASFAELDQTGTCAVYGAFNRTTYAVALPIKVGRAGIRMSMSCGKASMRPDLVAARQRITPVLQQAAVRLQEMLAHVDGPL
jgi:DNA-binding IclR family transcriptional regulator